MAPTIYGTIGKEYNSIPIVTRTTAVGTVIKIALISTGSFVRKITHEIKAIIITNRICRAMGNHRGTDSKSSGMKRPIN